MSFLSFAKIGIQRQKAKITLSRFRKTISEIVRDPKFRQGLCPRKITVDRKIGQILCLSHVIRKTVFPLLGTAKNTISHIVIHKELLQVDENIKSAQFGMRNAH
jgi:hypothetical protein